MHIDFKDRDPEPVQLKAFKSNHLSPLPDEMHNTGLDNSVNLSDEIQRTL